MSEPRPGPRCYARGVRALLLSGTFALGACVPEAGNHESQAGAQPASARPDAPASAERDANAAEFPVSRGGQELVGSRAQPLSPDLRWLSHPIESLESLRGEVVLVRFWTDACPFCEASAPGLMRLHERYADEGLVVIGVFHPKPRGELIDIDALTRRAAELGLSIPIAIDRHWSTLDSWWLRRGQGPRRATSTSFLIDAEGRVRWIHPGPEFHPDGPADHDLCRRDFADAERAVELLLAERARPRPMATGT